MVDMHGRMLHKIGMLVVSPYSFIMHSNNSGLVAKVEDKTGTVWKVPSTDLLPYLSAPKQGQIGKLPVYIVNKDAGECLMGDVSPSEPPEPPIDVANLLGYPEAPVGGAE